MEPWILYGLVGALFSGLSQFCSKIVASKGLNKNRMFLYSMLCFIVFPIPYLVLNQQFIQLSIIFLFLFIIRAIAALEKNLFIIESLKYIETSLFFPIFNTIKLFITFLLGMFLFGEYLTIVQICALILGIIVIYLLSSKENRKIQVDYKKGILFMLVANFLVIFSSTINKYIIDSGFDVTTYMFFAGIITASYLLISKRDIFDNVDKDVAKNEIQVGLLRGTLTYVGFFLGLMALKDGPFVLVSMLYTSSMFVAIILSILIFNEKINFKKILAFVLFIVVIYLINI